MKVFFLRSVFHREQSVRVTWSESFILMTSGLTRLAWEKAIQGLGNLYKGLVSPFDPEVMSATGTIDFLKNKLLHKNEMSATLKYAAFIGCLILET